MSQRSVGAVSVNWRQTTFVTALLCIGLLVLFNSTVSSMVSIWWRSETFAHGFFILPITLYLIWRLKHELKLLTPQPTLLGLPILALLGFAWLLAYFASVAVVEQLVVVAMLPVTVFSMLGWNVTKKILFPLLFLIFAVPMGEGLIPPMMEFTADFTVKMLQLTGTPVFREGLFFEIPSGRWSVVEGCSGVRYLIASVTLGSLYAYLTYTNSLRRSVFIIASFIVPVIANGFRAYLIVMIAHHSDYKLAMGVDHFIYGWVWFGIVITLMFWAGSFWRQEHDEVTVKVDNVVASARSPLIVAGAVIAVALVWPAWAKLSDRVVKVDSVSLSSPQHAGWRLLEQNITDWRPRYVGPDAELMQSYQRGDVRVSLYLGYYREQRQNAELVNSQNLLVKQKHPVWSQIAFSEAQLNASGKTIDVWQAKLRSVQGENLQVVYWHWLDGRYTINPYLSKLYDAKAKLLGQDRDGAVIILVTEQHEASDTALSDLQQFANDMLPEIQQQLNSIVK